MSRIVIMKTITRILIFHSLLHYDSIIKMLQPLLQVSRSCNMLIEPQKDITELHISEKTQEAKQIAFVTNCVVVVNFR